jgi:hypothetical protein
VRRGRSIASKLQVLWKMLGLDAWSRWPLGLRVVSPNIIVSADLPAHIKVTRGPLDSMPFAFADSGVAEGEMREEHFAFRHSCTNF